MILLRADIDALPLEEKTNLDFKSTHPGIQHACGHDGHTAILLIVIKVLWENYKERLNGTIKFVFQPAEEGSKGAISMIEDKKYPVLHNPDADFAFGLHLMSTTQVGVIEVKEGYFSANSDRFNVKITGKGGHGSAPHVCIDPVYVANQIINLFYGILARNMNPMTCSTFSITKINAGQAPNVIPEECSFGGTIRTVELEDKKFLKKRMLEIIEGAKLMFACQIEFNYDEGTSAIYNHKGETEKIITAASSVVGRSQVMNPRYLLYGEDFSFFTQKIPGAYFLVGAAVEGTLKSLSSLLLHHSPNFNFDEEALLIGASVFMRLIENELI